MKLILPILFFFSTGLAQATEVPDYPADKIAANTYVIHGPVELPDEINLGFMNNPGFVVTNDGVVVIDPGSSLQIGKMVLRQIKKITDKPVTHVLNTHIHGDHWLGNQAFSEAYPEALIMAHPKMISKANNGDAKRWLNLLERMTNGATKGTKPVVPTKAIHNAFQFKTGGMTFEIFASDTAHSRTDIMIHIIERSVVFTGDNVLNRRIASMDDATFVGNIKACDTALQIKARHYVPGHGQSSNIGIVSQFKTYLNIVYSQATHYYDEGLSDFEMKPKIVAQLNDFKDWSDFDQMVGKHISLATLEAEAEAFK